MFLFTAFLVFSAALWAAAWYVWRVPRQEEQRILAARLRDVRARAGGARRRAVGDLLIEQKRGAFAFAGEFLNWLAPLRRLQEFIQQANLPYRAGDVAAVSLLLFAAFYFLLGILGAALFLLRLLLAAAIAALPFFYIVRARNKRLRRFEEQLPEAIDLFNRSIRAGHNIQAGLETIASESLEPVKMELRRVVEELALGSQLEAALHNLGRRVPLVDLKFFITGLILQRQTGANMVAVLDNLASLIRERLNLAARMKAATTQQRVSAAVLCTLPVVVGLGFWVVKPEYIRMLYADPTGSKLFTYAIVSELIGILIIRRISSPRF